jgi:RAD51-like protein 1
MRSEFGREKLVERQALLGAQAARLKQLAEAFRIPIVVTNQVTVSRAPENAFGVAAPPDAGASDAQIAAALGTKWAHDVNTRLSLELSDVGERLLSVRASCGAVASLLRRRRSCIGALVPQIRKSPAAPALAFPYEVRSAGVVLVGDARDAGVPGAAFAAAEDAGAAFFSN